MKEKIQQFLASYYPDLMFYTLAVIWCICMVGSFDLSYDELSWTIRFVHNQSMISMLGQLIEGVYNLPLFYIVLNVIDVFSHHPIWLRVPSIVAALGAVYYTQKCVVRFYGRNCRLFSFILITLTPIFASIAFQIRPYAFLLFFSAYSFDAYYERLLKDSKKNILRFGIALTLLVYTHWYGALLAASYGLTDLYLWLKKKVRFKCILSYILCFLLFVPWFLAVIVNHHYNLSVYFGNKENYGFLAKILYYITGGKISLWVILTMFVVMGRTVSDIFRKHTPIGKYHLSPMRHIVFIILFIWTTMYLYAHFSQNGSIVVGRYFFVFLPQVIILLAGSSVEIYRRCRIFVLMKKSALKTIVSVAGTVVVLYGLTDAFMTFVIKIPYEFPEFDTFGQYHQAMISDYRQNKKKILSLSYTQIYWDYFKEDMAGIDAATFILLDDPNYSKEVKTSREMSEKGAMEYFESRRFLQEKDCASSMRYMEHKEGLKGYLVLKNGRTVFEPFPLENICDYEIIYTDAWLSSGNLYVGGIINKYFNTEDVLSYISRLTKIQPVAIPETDEN